MTRIIAFSMLTILSVPGFSQVFTYEANDIPEASGWPLEQRVCNPEVWAEEGVYHQILDHRSCQPPGGGFESFRRSLSDYLGVTRFFLEVKLEADGPRSEIPWGGPAAFALGSNHVVRYTFYVARDQAVLNRDAQLPTVFVDIAPGVAHTFRLESYDDDLYIWYIDGVIVDSGVPEGPYPMHTPSVVWVGDSNYSDNIVHWDYIRYGRIPDDGSGDFDSDLDIDLFDFRYFAECLDMSGPAVPSGPGCRWADLNGDADTDLGDFAALQNQFTGEP